MVFDYKIWAEMMKERYLRPKDWHHVRFSDEVTLDMVHRASCVLFTSQVNNTVLIIFRKIRNPTKKTKNAITIGLQWAMILN